MKTYWIHYSPDQTGGSATFGILVSDGGGYQRMLSPPGGISSDDAQALLVKRGADAAEARRQLENAMRQGVAHLPVSARP